MGKIFKTSDKSLLKALFLALNLFMISCSKEQIGSVNPGVPPVGGNPVVEQGFSLTLMSFGSYTKDELIRIYPLQLVETDEKELGSVKFWSGVPDCSGIMSGLASKALFTNPTLGAQVQLGANRENLLSYRVEFTDGSESDCEIAGAIIHDDISPVSLVLGSVSVKTNQASFHSPLLNIPIDGKEIHVYKNGEVTRAQTLNAGVWRNGLGVMNIPLNQTTSFTFQVMDFAGNLSPMSGALSIQHNNTAPASPVISAPTLALSETVVTTPGFNLSGTVGATVTNVLVYLSNTLSAPILTLTKAEFEAGHTVPLVNGSVNTFILVAIDEFGNESNGGTILIPANQTPTYVYSLLTTELYADNRLAVNKLTTIKLVVYNSSRESALNFMVPVTTFSASESSPNIAIDNSQGCPITGISASGVCDIYITAQFASTGVKTESFQVVLNGTTINVNAEFEVVSPVVTTLSAGQLTSLGAFKMLSLSRNHLIFTNGVSKADLTQITINSTLAADMENAISNYKGTLVGIKTGKIQIIRPDLTTKTLTSTRNYNPGSIIDIKNLGSKFAVLVNNTGGSQDLLVEDAGEILDQSIASNLGEGIDSVYFRSGTNLRQVDPVLNVSNIAGLAVTGDIFTNVDHLVVLGNSGSGDSLHKITGISFENLGTLSGASSFNKLNESVFAFTSGANFGAFAGKVAVSNATQAITLTDVDSVQSTTADEIFNTINIKTPGGDRTVIAKYLTTEDQLVQTQLVSATYGTKIGGPYFDKDGDFFISNQGASSVVVSRGGEDTYASITSPLTMSTPHFDKVVFTENQIVFTNLVSGNYQLNSVDIFEGAASPSLGYHLPSDISPAAPIELIRISDSLVLVYYANQSAGMTFKTITIL